MKTFAMIAASLMLATPGAAGAEVLPVASPDDCRDHAHNPNDPCACQHEAIFYQPVAPWHVSRPGGPGVRVYGRPVVIPSGRVDIQGPPVWVEAPPIRIAAPQIYLHAPDVHVRPSEVTVEPPEVHYVGCEDGGCAPVG